MLSRIKNFLSSCLAPPFCLECREFLTTSPQEIYLCTACRSLIKPILTKTVTLSHKYTMTVHALGDYLPPLTTLIRAKTTGLRSSTMQLAQLMARELPTTFPIDYLVPVPLYWKKEAYRGFNQSQEIAQYIAKQIGKPVIHAVSKIRSTANQTSLTHDKRTTNLRGAFSLTAQSSLLQDKHILLIDDVMTTGSTLVQIASLIITTKPASITALVGARVITVHT